MCVVDKWRVVLKGETPDYVNASVAHVSSSTDTYMYIVLCGYWYAVGLQAAESLHHSSESHAIHCQRFLEDGL